MYARYSSRKPFNLIEDDSFLSQLSLRTSHKNKSLQKDTQEREESMEQMVYRYGGSQLGSVVDQDDILETGTYEETLLNASQN